MLILTGGLLFVADKARATEGKVTISKAIIRLWSTDRQSFEALRVANEGDKAALIAQSQ